MKRIALLIIGFAVFAFADAGSLMTEGTKLHDEGRYDEAIAKYKQAEKLDPNNALVKYEISYSYYMKRDMKESLRYIKAAAKVNKDLRLNDAIYGMMGTIYDDSNKPDSALTAYRKGASFNQNSYLLPFNAAITFRRLEKPDSAKVWLKKSLANTKLHETSHLQMFAVSKQLGQWVDFYSYAMYTPFVAKKRENTSTALSDLYNVTKSLVNCENKKKCDLNLPKLKTTSDEDLAVVSVLAFAQLQDSVGHRHYYEKDTSSAQQMEFLVHMVTEAVKIIADFKDTKNTGNTLTEFYKGLVKNKLVEAFAYTVCKDADYPTYAKWKLSHGADIERLYKWANEDFLGAKGK
ncbi:MAG: tetratricopeptide repeat protein [Fibrobacter sp.]|uniref:tetratricopeptide repeat protein n=1 Tax=Fibrobacter sp. TaxID=35828 RepID=UPI001B095BC4|nr:tetratricopeptide repeat protein [Fibrobacter sp.]MBO7062136.1 tetratricopeptide repeat protein [Fibrobacter sp.]